MFAGSMREIPAVSPPCPFLRIDDGWASGTFQAGFVEGPVRYLIGVREGRGSSLQFHAGNITLQGGEQIELQRVNVELSQAGELLVRDSKEHNHVQWRSGSGRAVEAARTLLKLDKHTGQLSIEDSARHGQILWDPMAYLREIGYECRSKNPVLHLGDSKPYLQVTDGGSTLFTTHAESRHFDLFAGDFVAVALQMEAGPPPVPLESRPGESLSSAFASISVAPHAGPPLPPRAGARRMAYLWLDPQTSQLVLHTSNHPQQPEREQVVWISPNWKQCHSEHGEPSKATLQG